MRKPRDGEDTKQRVLNAAQELFAAKGFAGTSLADISQRCGISDGLILHHFQSKRNLYNQVLETLAEQYSQVLVGTRESSGSLQEMMQRMMTTAFDFWRKDTVYERISMWAYLEGESGFAEKETLLTAELAQGVKQLQEQGILDKRYAPMVLLTMVIGPIHFWVRFRDLFKNSLNLSESAEELDQQFLQQMIRIFTEITHKE